MVADAGLWVRLTGSVTGKGQVRFVADTGACRPLGDLVAATSNQTPPGDPAAVEANRAEAAMVLARLRVSPTQWNTYRAPCPGGGAISTVEAIGADGVEPGALDEVLRGLGGPVVATPDAYAYTSGPHHVAVRNDAKHIVVTSTSGCP